MFSENQRALWAIILGIAILITVGSLLYSNHLVRKLAIQEEIKVQLYAEGMEFYTQAYKESIEQPDSSKDSSNNSSTQIMAVTESEILPTDSVDSVNTSTLIQVDTAVSTLGEFKRQHCDEGIDFVFKHIIKNNKLIPTILVGPDNASIVSHINLGLDPELSFEEADVEAKAYLQSLKDDPINPPIEIIFQDSRNYVYYDESTILKQLRIFPYLQLLVIIIFISIVFAAYSIAKKNEQNRVWVGLAKETAHQLGTPVSSMMAWVELLKIKLDEKPSDIELVNELHKDVNRLEVITERFSKIGSEPELKEVPIAHVLNNSAEYIRKRMSKRVTLNIENKIHVDSKFAISQPLFEWVIENLLKNALDAMPGTEGTITIQASESSREYLIDITDTGKGIPKGSFEKVFKPGYTTKKRGWGLGLSLTRRIVENYHKGKIYVKWSEQGKGTTFRIQLPKSS